ncbi:MAG TPA: ATP-dependent endonuclease [Pirellulales bacterium]|nr:ATP-dependent endonuclease [Pirellulales bacterium]
MNAAATVRPVLVIVEGVNDIEFLKRLASRLHTECPEVVDLARLHAQGRILFVPTGGGNFSDWATRFAGLACREFHLYDRELVPETERRQRAVELVNARPQCRGFLTAKRSLENYLHPSAVAQAGGGEIPVGDDECVGSVLARHWYELILQYDPWPALSHRARRRLVYRAKRWLNRQAVGQMTVELLSERDPGGEVLQWLEVIAGMARAMS